MHFQRSHPRTSACALWTSRKPCTQRRLAWRGLFTYVSWLMSSEVCGVCIADTLCEAPCDGRVHPKKMSIDIESNRNLQLNSFCVTDARCTGFADILTYLSASFPMPRGGGDFGAHPTIGRWAGHRIALLGDGARWVLLYSALMEISSL